jgi:hypothetical protein
MAELEPKLDILREQQRAIRDILFLYRGLADTCGISGDDHLGSFDPWRWLQCEPDYDDSGVWRSFDDALLLRQGSAVALRLRCSASGIAAYPTRICGRSRWKRVDLIIYPRRAAQCRPA